jgi:hypothetical protein
MFVRTKANMDIKRHKEQLFAVRELFPIQRQILSDLCRGAQVIQCHDGTYRACIDIAGRSRLSAYGLDASAMTRLCMVVWQIDTAFIDAVDPKNPNNKSESYMFHYIPAIRRMEVSDLLTLTIKAPAEAFVPPPGAVNAAENDRDVVVGIPRDRPGA